MHVCVLTAGAFPPDGRIERAAEALVDGGHTVTVCARGTGDHDRETVDGIDVRRVADESLYAGLGGVLDGARYALRFVHPAWLRAAGEADDESAVDACCVCDCSLLKTGHRVGERLDVPVVCDLPGPAAASAPVAARGDRVRDLVRRIVHSPWRRRRVLEGVLPDADRLVTTGEEARAAYVRETDVDPHRVAVVRDTADAALATTAETDARARGLAFDPREAFVVTAVADDAPRAALETFVEATARAADDVVDLRAVIIGGIDETALDYLESLARRRLVGGRVTFRTEADPGRTADYLATSDVCFLPRSARAPATAVPRPLFEALALGVPVVADATPPLRRLLARADAGRVVAPEDERALADALVALADAETAAALGANGRAATDHDFNRERDAGRLRDLYEGLLARSSAANGPASRFDSAITDEPTS